MRTEVPQYWKQKCHHAIRTEWVCDFYRSLFLVFFTQFMAELGWAIFFTITTNERLTALHTPDKCQQEWNVSSASYTRWNAFAPPRRVQSAKSFWSQDQECSVGVQDQTRWKTRATCWYACPLAARITSFCPMDFKLLFRCRSSPLHFTYNNSS